MIDKIKSIDVDLESSDIVRCHCLAKTNSDIKKNKPSKQIKRFINRKKVSSCLKNKNKLGETYICVKHIKKYLRKD